MKNKYVFILTLTFFCSMLLSLFSEGLKSRTESNKYLDKKLDPFGIPLINLNWKMSNKLKRTAKESLISLGKFLIDKKLTCTFES